jgi:hypothetical protein
MTPHQISEATKDPVLLLFAALGITFQPHLYLGGLFFALACAAIARRLFPEDGAVEWGWTLALAALLSTLVAVSLAQVYPHVGPPLVPQVAMAVTGFLSRWIARIVVRLAGSVEAGSDTLFDRLLDRVLPPRKPPSDGGEA